MLSRFFLFYLLMYLTGSPFFAVLVIIALYLLLDYQFTGFMRRGFGAIRIASEIAGLKKEIALNPHNAAALSDIGRLLVMRRKESQALPYLEQAYERLSESEETTYYLGLAYLKTGQEGRGEALLLKTLEMNPRFRYGEPALRLAEHYAEKKKITEALAKFDQFFSIHSSSSEGYYKFGRLQLQIGNIGRAIESFQKAIEVFKLSPSFKKREDRLWAYKARYHLGKARLAHSGTH